MFTSLKNKIKEETGSDISTTSSATTAITSNRISNNNRTRSRFSSTISINSSDEIASSSNIDLHNYQSEITSLRAHSNDLTTKLCDLNKRIQELQVEKLSIEKTNEILLETVKETQKQKNTVCKEQEKFQNMQQTEIEKLKNLLSFREQEAVDRLSALRQSQQQIENLTGELERLKRLEPMVEDLQDELERLRHSSQLGKNNLTTTLAAVEEENNHLKTRLQIINQSRLNAVQSLSSDEKIQALIQERKLLEQHLEEAHLQLSDIKSSWCGQNLALETQVSRLSKQVAEETTEKRKALKARDDCSEKLKQLQFEIEKMSDVIRQRDDKIKTLEEEIDEINLALKKNRDESEQQIIFEHSKVESLELDIQKLQIRLIASDERLTEYAENSEKITKSLRKQNSELNEQILNISNQLEQEKEEKLTALLRIAEISQSEEILKKELRIERDEITDLIERIKQLQIELKSKNLDISNLKFEIDELKVVKMEKNEKLNQFDEIQRELNDKNKTIKILNQRLADIKKTLQKEFRSKSFDGGTINNDKTVEFQNVNGFFPSMGPPTSSSSSAALAATAAPPSSSSPQLPLKQISTLTASYCSCENSNNFNYNDSNSSVLMNEVNFKYLKHVIVKFLTSREVEARHLIRVVAMLLKLNKEEEKLLHDTLNWKMSWFGSKPDHGTGQRAFSIPPS